MSSYSSMSLDGDVIRMEMRVFEHAGAGLSTASTSRPFERSSERACLAAPAPVSIDKRERAAEKSNWLEYSPDGKATPLQISGTARPLPHLNRTEAE